MAPTRSGRWDWARFRWVTGNWIHEPIGVVIIVAIAYTQSSAPIPSRSFSFPKYQYLLRTYADSKERLVELKRKLFLAADVTSRRDGKDNSDQFLETWDCSRSEIMRIKVRMSTCLGEVAACGQKLKWSRSWSLAIVSSTPLFSSEHACHLHPRLKTHSNAITKDLCIEMLFVWVDPVLSLECRAPEGCILKNNNFDWPCPAGLRISTNTSGYGRSSPQKNFALRFWAVFHREILCSEALNSASDLMRTPAATVGATEMESVSKMAEYCS